MGSGIAGLVFALRVAEAGQVTLLTKKRSVESNTNLAQGGIAAVSGGDDTFELHVQDTLSCGEGLSDESAVRRIVEEGPALVRELAHIGVRFSRKGKDFELGREGGHSRRRIVHAKDATGREVERALLHAARTHPNISILEYHQAIDLVVDSNRHVWGAHAIDLSNGSMERHLARQTLLATGGAGKVYLYTTNPDIASGDGFAIAYRAGARLANLEFVQFHPTCLYHPQEKSFLISEAVRGEGAILRTISGRAFMKDYHPMKDLAPRDAVARAIDNEMKRRGDRHVLLDLSRIPPGKIRNRFPNIHRFCEKLGMDITSEPIPVVPAAHYMCGGVIVDNEGRTSLSRLYACGEVTHTGVHGANRLASNSLLEALVFATAAAESAKRADISTPFPKGLPVIRGRKVHRGERLEIRRNWDHIHMLMWDYVGIVRTTARLKKARSEMAIISRAVDQLLKKITLSGDLVELRNISLVGSLIIRSALRRKESRGLHFNTDYPEKQKKFERNTVVYRRKID